MLTFATDRGDHVTIAPLALSTLVDRSPGIERFQIVQSTPTSLGLRLRPAAGVDPDRVWRALQAQIRHLFTEHKLDHVTLERAEEPPEQSPGASTYDHPAELSRAAPPPS